MDKFYCYTTLQGDTFDSISLDFYNDEKYSSEIIKSNPRYTKVIVFEAGIKLYIPVKEQTLSSIPPWKR